MLQINHGLGIVEASGDSSITVSEVFLQKGLKKKKRNPLRTDMPKMTSPTLLKVDSTAISMVTKEMISKVIDQSSLKVYPVDGKKVESNENTVWYPINLSTIGK